jgi:hypothetical protein
MQVVAIDQDSVSRATKRWVQGFEAFIEVYFDELFARILDQSVDKVCIRLGHCNVVRISSGWYLTIAKNDLREFMDRCANGSGFACRLIRHEGLKPV